MFPLQIICLILDKQKAKAISNCGFSVSHWLILLTQSSYTMTLILVERRRGHVGRWSWWREGHVWKDLSSAEAFVGGGAQKSRTSASSTSRPSPAATPLRYCSLLPCCRTEGDGTSIWVMPCWGSLACLLFLARAWRRWPSDLQTHCPSPGRPSVVSTCSVNLQLLPDVQHLSTVLQVLLISVLLGS